MDMVLDHLRDRADFILLDTAPALIVSDTLALAPKADGIVVVVDAAQTKRGVLTHLRTQLDRVGGNVVACILNDFETPAKGDSRYGYYSSKYAAKYSADEYNANLSQNGSKTSRKSRRRAKRERS
jgi:non-specific protein-tyrosine kinase